MMDSLSLLLIVASLFLIITPGQDLILVMSRSIAQGWKAGVVTAAAVSSGLLGHRLLTALGLGAALMASEMVFVVIKSDYRRSLCTLGIRLAPERRN